MKCVIFLVLSVLVGVSFQQPRQRCFETPVVWSGVFFVRDFAQSRSDFGYIYYNQTAMKLLYDYDSHDGRTFDAKKVWIIYEERKVYTYDKNTRTCTSRDIGNERFPTFGAPLEATFRHHDRLGSYLPNLGVTTDYFRMDTEDGGVYHGYYTPVYDGIQSESICIPVIESYEKIDTAPTHQSDTHFTFMNITTDPIDPIVWIFPRECLDH